MPLIRKKISSCFSKKRTAYFQYDQLGNVASILIDVPHDSILKQRYKKINYYYDLISGNVNELAYEQDSIDQFIHNYDYDADNRLLCVTTSRDSLYWENEADYEYYDHGPLAREVIGRRQVQGLDFAYTLNGWLKGVNSGILNPSKDPGGDGDVHSANNATVARDAYGFVLNYFNGDYRSIGRTNFQTTGLPITSQYNGNIAGATYSIKNISPSTLGYTYSFDQLNRYRGDSVFKTPDSVNNTWNTRTGINDLKERVSYDENGNILVYLRHGNTAVGPLAMDSLTYHYTKGRNQLAQVNDVVPSTNYTVDIHNENSNRNYQYNGIGELAKDSAGGLDTIIWNVYGKVKAIKKHNGDSIVMFYDPMGNRLEKRLYPHSGTADTTMYARNGSGSLMAVYDRHKDTVRLIEWDMYGLGRLGSVDTIMRMQKLTTGVGTIDSLTISYLEGQKQYELTNHLGNVMVTVSDRKIPVDTVSTDTLAKYYLPLVISATGYCPFGMPEIGRSFLLSGDSAYRYGNDGQEKDNSIYGNGNAYTAEYWEYDPRLGKRWNPDPVVKPWESPYATFSDNPIYYADPTGLSGEGPGGMATSEDAGEASGEALTGVTAASTTVVNNSNGTTTTSGTFEGGGWSVTTETIPSSNSSEKKWASQYGYFVHQTANFMAFRGDNTVPSNLSDLDKKKLKAMNKATAEADSKQYQNGPNAFRHAMRNGDKDENGNDIETKEQAMNRADAFVRRQFSLAREFLQAGDIDDAYYFFGLGLHTLQDATSPVHGGFQPWSSDEDIEQEAWHVSHEDVYPGAESNLQKITDKYLKWFEGKEELPTDNLFKDIQSDPFEFWHFIR
jgi:hypothetical protein